MQEWQQFAGQVTQDGYDVFHTDCPARTVLDHVTSKWGVWILLALRGKDLRFFELRTSIEGISEKMLSQTLRTLVRDGLVWRAVRPATPPQVSYGLTTVGKSTSEPLADLFESIRGHATDILAVQAEFDAAGASD